MSHPKYRIGDLVLVDGLDQTHEVTNSYQCDGELIWRYNVKRTDESGWYWSGACGIPEACISLLHDRNYNGAWDEEMI